MTRIPLARAATAARTDHFRFHEIARGFDDERIQTAIDDTKPWFRFAAESAAPRRVHIAKSTVISSDMIRREFDPDLVHETESISTIAFGRTLFEPSGVQYSPSINRARRDGRIETEIPLMSVPAYTRARPLAVRLRESMPADDFQKLCLYNAESQAILQALEAAGDKLDFSRATMYACVVPDRGASNRTMDAALATLQDLVQRNRQAKKKPWWKFW